MASQSCSPRGTCVPKGNASIRVTYRRTAVTPGMRKKNEDQNIKQAQTGSAKRARGSCNSTYAGMVKEDCRF